MVLWAVAATVVAACSLLILILYRRQVKKTCRQLAFLREHTTNLRLTGGLPFSEWEELVDGVNAILDQAREGRRTAQREEAALKEAITHLSHDIRTPLTSLDGYFQLLLQSPSAEEQQRYSAVIQSRIASLRDMLEELFTYARLQDKEAPLALEPVDFAACVYDTVFAFYEDFQAKGLTPQADFCDGHLWVQGNGEALRRTVQNLVKNALEHGGREIAFALFQRDGAAGFRCTNQVDRPEEIDVHQVFRRFYKADAARTHTSTGLGLAIAQGLTERMGGHHRGGAGGEHLFRHRDLSPGRPAGGGGGVRRPAARGESGRRFQGNVLSKEGCILRWEGVPWQGISHRDIGG